MLRPNTQPMLEPPAKKPKKLSSKKGGKGGGGGGGGFGKQAAKALTPAEQLHQRRVETVQDDGVCLIPNALSKETAAELLACVSDELSRAYASVEEDPETCVARFNVPKSTFDPLRGYLLLPLVDEASAEEQERSGPIVRALRELLAPGSVLGELFSSTCGGVDAEFYDLVALRTEPGATRQPIHSDTPYQKIPALFCVFLALQDVRYEMGATVFLPGTHKGPKGPRKAFDDGAFDGSRDEMLSAAQSRYTMLSAGDAAFFNMNTLHAGTANYAAEEGGSQRLLFVLTFRNRRGKQPLSHAPNLRPAYRNRGITLEDMRNELAGDNPFGGVHLRDGRPFGDGLPAKAEVKEKVA